MKVLLVGINSKFIHSNLAVRYLKTFTRELNYESKIREFSINEREEIILKEIINEKPDVVAFSVYIWNVTMVSHLANLIKNVSDNIEIVFGGPEVSYDSIDFLENNNGDYVILGEGEVTFKEFIEYKLGDRSINTITGLCYKEDGKVYSNGIRPLMNMDDIVFPYQEDDDLNNKIVYFEASRGCPFNCIYCLSSTTHGVRFHNINKVIQELQYFIDKKVKLVKFVDRTFNCNHEFAMRIWEFLINAETDTQFHFEISADILKADELELLKKAPNGRFQFEVGVQTTNDEVLKNIHRFVNFSDIKEKVVELVSIKNIKQHLDLIAGLPGEDYDSFKESFNAVHSIRPEEIQLGFLKLLKGSEMRSVSDKYDMKYSPYPPYEILRTNKISYSEILKLKRVEAVVDKYYNSQKFNHILEFFYQKFDTPFEFFYKLGSYFEEKGYLNVNVGNSEYYKVFLDFNKEVLKQDNEFLVEIIKYDYLLFNKRKELPQILRKDIDKEIQAKIKEKYRETYSFKEYHIEMFSIDLDTYIKNGKLLKLDTYYLVSSTLDMIRVSDI